MGNYIPHLLIHFFPLKLKAATKHCIYGLQLGIKGNDLLTSWITQAHLNKKYTEGGYKK